MTEAALAALMLFNGTVATYSARYVPEVRVFAGLQPGTGDADAWTTCVPDSGVFVVQVAAKTLDMPADQIKFAAVHEVAHLKLHRNLICGGGYAGLLAVRKREIENEADHVAVEMMAEAQH